MSKFTRNPEVNRVNALGLCQERRKKNLELDANMCDILVELIKTGSLSTQSRIATYEAHCNPSLAGPAELVQREHTTRSPRTHNPIGRSATPCNGK